MARRRRTEACKVETPGSAQDKFHRDYGSAIGYMLRQGYTTRELVSLFVGSIRDANELNWPDPLAQAYKAQMKFGYLDNLAYIYVWVDEKNHALYVGQTEDIVQRTREHYKNEEPWTKEAKNLLVFRSSKALKLRDEQTKIEELRPKYNIMHNTYAIRGDEIR